MSEIEKMENGEWFNFGPPRYCFAEVKPRQNWHKSLMQFQKQNSKSKKKRLVKSWVLLVKT